MASTANEDNAGESRDNAGSSSQIGLESVKGKRLISLHSTPTYFLFKEIGCIFYIPSIHHGTCNAATAFLFQLKLS